jgi:hypothetical protein
MELSGYGSEGNINHTYAQYRWHQAVWLCKIEHKSFFNAYIIYVVVVLYSSADGIWNGQER